jgi:hypothetical protein
MARQQIAQSATGSLERIQPIQPCQADHLGAFQCHGAIRKQQHWHTSDAAKRVRSRHMIDVAAQPLLYTFDEAVATIAEREQAIAGTGEALGSLQGAHGSLESGGRDQAHVAFTYPSRDRPEDVR